MIQLSDYGRELKESGCVIPADAEDVFEAALRKTGTVDSEAFTEEQLGKFDHILSMMEGECREGVDMAGFKDTVVDMCNNAFAAYNEGRIPLDRITMEEESGLCLGFYMDGVQFGYADVSVGVDPKYLDNGHHDALMPDGNTAMAFDTGSVEWEDFENLGKAVLAARDAGFSQALEGVPVQGGVQER